MGGDFMSRSEAQVCLRRGIEDRIAVVRDLRRVEKHQGPIAAADQLGLGAGDLAKIGDGKLAISSALLVAMYGAGGARLLPSLVPREPIDAQVDKIMAACGARAPFDKLRVSGARLVQSLPPKPVMAFDMAKSPKPPAGVAAMGPRDRDAHERQILAEVGVSRETLVAILRRVRDAAGNWAAAGVELGLGKSTVMNLAGGHSKFSFRVAQLLLEWDRANPVPELNGKYADSMPRLMAARDEDAAAAGDNAAVDRGEVVPPLDPPPATVSTAAPPVASDLSPVIGTVDERAAADGAAGSPPHSPPQNTLIAANDDPFAVALTALVTARDAAQAARAAIGAEIAVLDGQIGPLAARRAKLEADEAGLLAKISALFDSVEQLQAVAK
jgi:hypothetical protein